MQGNADINAESLQEVFYDYCSPECLIFLLIFSPKIYSVACGVYLYFLVENCAQGELYKDMVDVMVVMPTYLWLYRIIQIGEMTCEAYRDVATASAVMDKTLTLCFRITINKNKRFWRYRYTWHWIWNNIICCTLTSYSIRNWLLVIVFFYIINDSCLIW